MLGGIQPSVRMPAPALLPHLCLSRLAPARWLALVAMLVQVLFFAEHLGASAVHGLGQFAPGARLGFLQICTGEGIALFDPASGRIVVQAGQAPPTAPGHGDCAVCASAGVCSFASPQAALAPAPVFILQAALDAALAAVFGFIPAIARPGHIRAPPQG